MIFSTTSGGVYGARPSIRNNKMTNGHDTAENPRFTITVYHSGEERKCPDQKLELGSIHASIKLRLNTGVITMTPRTKFLFLIAILVLFNPFVFAGKARGTPNYKGDGAVYNSGGWSQPVQGYCTPSVTPNTFINCEDRGGTWTTSDNTHCLGCHGSTFYLPDKSTYLATGHKNMLRPVNPGQPWKAADGTEYDTTDPYGFGSIFDWTKGTISVGGSAGKSETLFYIFGGWMDPGQLNTIYDGGFTGELWPNGNYDCGRCHTTGYRFDNSGPLPLQSDAEFSRVPDAPGPPATSSWYLNGIQCERCHRDVANQAGGHNCYVGGVYTPGDADACAAAGGNWIVNVPRLEDATQLCMECHRQEYSDSSGNVFVIQPPDIQVSNDDPAVYAPFFDASPGPTFLNSPHARFTGNIAQTAQGSPDLSVSMPGTYDSYFLDSWTGKNKGCDGCHDVHYSVVEATGQADNATNPCTQCHTNASDIITPRVNIANINHPGGIGTPLNGSNPCAVCHMPAGLHLFRIKTIASYTTFPTEDEFNSGQTTGKTSSDGKLTGAVWVDLDLACGQCHVGGGEYQTAPQNGAPQLDRDTLAAYAKNMHNTENSNCAISLSSDLKLHVPILAFNGQSYTTDFQYIQGTSDIALTNYKGLTDVSLYNNCTPASLSKGLKLHMPTLVFNGASYWADFQFKEGLTFTLVAVGPND